jgi:hypothetical protein
MSGALLRALACAALAAASAPLPPHPRLLLTPARADAILSTIATNAQAASYFRNLTAQAAAHLPLPPVPRPADGGNVLGAARLALVRTYIFGAMWRLTRNATFAARGVAEVLCFTTQWSDWQPVANALVMGELSHAAAIGIDWLADADAMDNSTRAAIVAGLVARGAAPFAAAYAAGVAGGYWWVCASTNWCSVTNSGSGLAALALLGEAGAPSYVGDLLANATRFVKCSAAAPAALGTGGGLSDSGWWEGAMCVLPRAHLRTCVCPPRPQPRPLTNPTRRAFPSPSPPPSFPRLQTTGTRATCCATLCPSRRRSRP